MMAAAQVTLKRMETKSHETWEVGSQFLTSLGKGQSLFPLWDGGNLKFLWIISFHFVWSAGGVIRTNDLL